jgi:hypothetical protein
VTDRRRRLLKIASRAVAALALLYILLCGVMYMLLRQRPPAVARVFDRLPAILWITLPMPRIWKLANRGSLHPGDMAPDFDLPTLDRKSRVKLSALRGGKPVVLVFGSYTCPPFRKGMEGILGVYERHRERADFYFIYIQEAHARDSWPAGANAREKISYAMHRTEDERVEVAGVCSTKLKIPFPMLVDTMDDHTEQAYSAWPVRLYIVDPAGRVAFKSETGPFGFEADVLEKALVRATAPQSPRV